MKILVLILVAIAIVELLALWWVLRRSPSGVPAGEFLQKMFSEPTGQPSFGRGSFGFVIVCTMALLAYQIASAKVYSLEAWAWFLMAVGGVTYAGGKVTAAWGANKIEAEPKPPADDKAKAVTTSG